MSNKIKKKQLKQIENQAQEGRSMVEMLGVLAIIGVLSIGGIAGYRMAMNRYQANQIANEINLMRTDAKMKVARGVDELLLGEPYDGEGGHLNFGSNYGVKVESKDIVDGEITEKGYSFTLSNIPEGVCKPLVALLDNMDDTADITIGSKSYYDENASEDFCGETNEVMVAFSTKDIGGVSSGSGDPEGPEQGDEPQDNDPVPEECPRGTTLSDDKSECTCEEDEKTCNGGCCAGCSGGKVWTGRKCACPAGAELSEDGEDCACSTATPYWDGTKCTTCPEGSQPQDGKCVCSSDTSKEWKASLENGGCDKERVGECQKNSDCGLGEYCYMYWGYNCGDKQEFDPNKFGGYSTRKSKCRNARGDIDKEGADGKFVLGKAKKDNTDNSKGYMTWWSAERFCNALGRPQAKRESIGCGSVDDVGSMCTSETLTTLQTAGFSDWVWLEDYGNSCRAYAVGLGSGRVAYDSRNYTGYCCALCE